MRWQDKAATVTAVEHRISEYSFPFFLKKHENIKHSRFKNSVNYWAGNWSKLLLPRWWVREGGVMERDQRVQLWVKALPFLLSFGSGRIMSCISGGEGNCLAIRSDVCTLLSWSESMLERQASVALAHTGPKASWQCHSWGTRSSYALGIKGVLPTPFFIPIGTCWPYALVCSLPQPHCIKTETEQEQKGLKNKLWTLTCFLYN